MTHGPTGAARAQGPRTSAEKCGLKSSHLPKSGGNTVPPTSHYFQKNFRMVKYAGSGFKAIRKLIAKNKAKRAEQRILKEEKKAKAALEHYERRKQEGYDDTKLLRKYVRNL